MSNVERRFKKKIINGVWRAMGQSYKRGAEPMTEETFAGLGVQVTEKELAYFNQQIQGMRHFEDKATVEFARLDPEFRDMWEASDRTHTALIIRDDVGPKVVDHSSSFNPMFDDFNDALRAARKAGVEENEAIEAYARQLGASLGFELNGSELAQVFDLVNSFKGIRVNPALQALGSNSVLRLRRLGANARLVVEEMADGSVKFDTKMDWNDLGIMNEKFTAIFNHYLPDDYQITDIIETNPAIILEHWVTNMANAQAEKVMNHFMIRSGLFTKPETRLALIDTAFNRYASNGAMADLHDVARASTRWSVS